jgi:hypothetical protein
MLVVVRVADMLVADLRTKFVVEGTAVVVVAGHIQEATVQEERTVLDAFPTLEERMVRKSSRHHRRGGDSYQSLTLLNACHAAVLWSRA